ncbi:methyl-accepting chemotaxis protein [Desulfobacter sp.]|uniref:methyl-accepting chemotaxis protein n=1 Tax=Desulfobacter sp. TaxID=2294 RepID=UPI003D11C16E
MFLGFMREKTIVSKDTNMAEIKKRLDQTWDLADNHFLSKFGVDSQVQSIFSLVFNKLNHTMTNTMKSVVALASLGPDLFRISGDFKNKVRLQSEKANEIASAELRISQGIEKISNRTQDLTQAFSGIEKEVTHALNKGDLSMAGFSDIQKQVSVLVDAIQVLKENSDSISSIIDVINNISDETNILSLNARIEAARNHGDGRGFKVIAEEVGNLAHQSKSATQDIQNRLNILQEKIVRTVDAAGQVAQNVTGCEQQINEANAALNNVCSGFGALSGNLAEINEAAERQAEDVRQVSANVVEIEAALADQVKDADTIFGIAEQVNTVCDEIVLSTGVFHLAGHQKAGQAVEKASKESAIRVGSRKDRDAALARLLDRMPFAELAYVTDAAGKQVSSNIYARALADQAGLEEGYEKNWREKVWFTTPASTGDTFISEVYRSSATKAFCFTVSVPLKENDRFAGVLGIDINVKDMLNI